MFSDEVYKQVTPLKEPGGIEGLRWRMVCLGKPEDPDSIESILNTSIGHLASYESSIILQKPDPPSEIARLEHNLELATEQLNRFYEVNREKNGLNITLMQERTATSSPRMSKGP